VENRGFWALEAPPKRAKQMNARGLFIGWQDTGVRSNALVICGRTQSASSTANNCWRLGLTWECVRPQGTCVRTHITARAGLCRCDASVVLRACDRGCCARPWVRAT
jgi:hypothetical protein